MTTLNSLTAALLVALGCAGSAGAADTPLRVGGEPMMSSKAERVQTWRLATYPAASVARLEIGGLPATRIAEVQKRNSRPGNIAPQIGVNRNVAAEGGSATLPALRWQSVAGGRVARFEFTSREALGLRLSLKLENLPDGVEMRFAGSEDPSRVLLVSAAEAKRLAEAGRYWSPVTDGETQVVELFVPSRIDAATVRLQVPQVSHLLTNSIERFSLAKAIGDSESCNVDTACRVGALGQNFVNTKNSVARMTFSDANGTYTCTGTLLNDTDAATQIPYFYSAHHCISTQAVANTLNTFWGFEATSCGSGVQAANIQRSGGAQYLYSSNSTDALLLRLNSAPPAGAYFNGWDAATLANGSQVLAVHHPSGDLKKSSLGQKISQDSVNHEVGWTSGTTEGGSSGSGLFTSSASGYMLRGGLYGGFAECANSGNLNNTNNRDYYSRLDVAYPNIQQYLAPAGATPGPTRNNGGLWYVPSESGWGLTVFQFTGGSQVLFVTWYTYNAAGQATWFQLDGTWTGTDVNSGPVRRYTGPAFGPTFNPAQVAFTNVGTATISFTSATQATFQYTVDGVSRTVTLSKIGS